ncbi:GDYXXLXY domain-containing protein [Flavobacterium sp.]|uniref:GDYXXLXY domain-containing protein n=1 Tax=Flavobacterium sp. TaxID=239 RepID=UPI00374D89D4
MKNKKTILIIFLLVVIVQLFVPFQMIWKQEDTLNTGKIVKFQCEPIDPNDPFRGKYITLSFKEREITVQNSKDWNSNETIFAKIITSKEGFAKIKSISKTEPTDDSTYIKLKIDYVSNYNNENKIFLNLPFNRFYMNENKAENAEQVYAETIIDTTKIAYAEIAVKKGNTVIKDVLVDGVSVKNLAKSNK